MLYCIVKYYIVKASYVTIPRFNIGKRITLVLPKTPVAAAVDLWHECNWQELLFCDAIALQFEDRQYVGSFQCIFSHNTEKWLVYTAENIQKTAKQFDDKISFHKVDLTALKYLN